MTTMRCAPGCDAADQGVGPVTGPECIHTRFRGIEECDRTLGSGDAPITVVMYGDLGSTRSARTYHSIRAAMAGSVGVTLAHRHVLDRMDVASRLAAEAAEAAAAQGAFWEMCDLLYRLSDARGSVIEHCQLLSLDERRLRDSITGGHGSARIDHDLGLAIASGVRSSPALFVNGVSWPTDDPHRDLRVDLEDVARRARPLCGRP